MRKTDWTWGWLVAALLAVAWALPAGTTADPATLTGGLAIGASLACITCGGMGIATVLYGGLAAFLWTRAAFAASSACIGICVTAVTT